MPERNPRKWTLFVCPDCNRVAWDDDDLGCCEGSADGAIQIPVTEDLSPRSPWEDLAAAITRLGLEQPGVCVAERLTGYRYVRLELPRRGGAINVELDAAGGIRVSWLADDVAEAEGAGWLGLGEVAAVVAEWAALRGDGDGD